MNGLVAAYLLFCPVNAPTQCSQHDQGVFLEKRFCGLTSRAYHPQGGAGTAKIVCRK
jgi:hypothetical protein